MAGNKLLMSDFDEVITFLAEHRWIFDFKLTRIFLENVLDNIPEEWKETLTNLSIEELAGLPFGKIQQKWPQSLKDFIQNCLRFSLPREVTGYRPISRGRVVPLVSTAEKQSNSVDQNSQKTVTCDNSNHGDAVSKTVGTLYADENDARNFTKLREETQMDNYMSGFSPFDVSAIDSNVRKGMSEKKIHEVCHMTSLIDHVTRMGNNNGVVDVGSGLGYLGQVLHCNYGHSVLGLEGKQGHTSGADRRLNKFECSGQLHNVTCEIYQESESQHEFTLLVKDWFNNLDRSRCSHQQSAKSVQQTGFKTVFSNSQTGTLKDQTGSQKNLTGSTNNLTDSINEPTGSLNIQTGCASIQTGSENDQTGSDKKNTGMSCCTQTCSKIANENILTGFNKADNKNKSLEPDFVTERDLGETKEGDEVQNSFVIGNKAGNGLMSKGSSGSTCTRNFCDIHKSLSLQYHDERGGTNTNENSNNNKICKSSEERHGTSLENDMTNSGNDMTNSDNYITNRENDMTNLENDMTNRENDMTNLENEMPYLENENIGENIAERCEASLDLDSSPQLCMVGLHCCGDLTPSMLKYFVDLDIITSLCSVSCCYHRMSYDNCGQQHENFPMSMRLEKSVRKTQQKFPYFKFSPYCLRLAAQETRARWDKQTWKDHEFHTKNVAYRGILEACLEQDERFSLKKSVRKLAHGADFESFTTYTEAVAKHIQMPEKDSVGDCKQLFLLEMQKMHKLYQQYFYLIEPLTALQYLLQPVIESLIYMDRKQWLEDHGYQTEIIPVFDELISPRNLALVAVKNRV